ncbi:MAG: DHH family phosphoesterase [Desulfovibrio sp.]|nr:DHH family phosphoesterase [Desulfovibrio sp.]
MSYDAFKKWLTKLNKEQHWCLLLVADPDALASAMAIRTILRAKVAKVEIRYLNTVTRPDNLAMLRYLRIPAQQWDPETSTQYTNFGIVDSQPTHNPSFAPYHYSLVIDHHPLDNISSFLAADNFVLIRTNFGATSTILAKLLRAQKKRPGSLLATALLYGIRTDTASFERSGGEEDLRAYHWLYKYANVNLLRRICRSEYLRDWLPLFARAFRSIKDCSGNGAYVSLNDVRSADLLVCIADFFTKVHGLRWIAVSGLVEKTAVVIFRGDGQRDMGQMANFCFSDVGKGGGHRNLARAEFPRTMVPENVKPQDFIYERLKCFKPNVHSSGASGELPVKTDD